MAKETERVGDNMGEGKILLYAQEVAELTGFSVGTVRHWVSEFRIPFVRFSSRCVRFRREDIDEWILANSVETRDEIVRDRVVAEKSQRAIGASPNFTDEIGG